MVLKVRRRSWRILIVTVSLMTVGFLCVLNLLVHELNFSEKIVNRKSENEFILEDPQTYIAQGIRKPQSAIDKSDQDNVNLDQGSYRKYIFTSHNNIPNDIDPDIGPDESDEEYTNGELMEDDDDDNDDEKDNTDDEFHENLKISPQLKKQRIFEPHDFQNMSKLIFAKPPLRFQEVPIINGKQMVGVIAESDRRKFSGKLAVSERIFWSAFVEKMVPKGFSDEEVFNYTINIQSQSVDKVELASWNKCGRPKNAYITLKNKNIVCARYRDSHVRFILGEVLSFYLSRLLGMDNVPAVVLSTTVAGQWSKRNLDRLNWKENQLVALIQWIPNMDTYSSYVKIPKRILKAYQSGQPIRGVHLENATLQEVVELQQWGSLFLFDYLTGNYDRVASMQDAAYEQKKPSIITERIRNLFKSTKTNKFWLIDNESGLLDAYDLMYHKELGGSRFINFHQQMLKTFCIFQKTTVTAIQRLLKEDEPHFYLYNYAMSHDPVLQKVLPNYKSNLIQKWFQMWFQRRLAEVYKWINHCAS
ncbi:four-jointed box protein 1-like [Saccostrea echinata]|uniref:four-jointed box protein 1-like n=1 Tax=Saccostrea echinata TaxID=191078 RepID=UPI002A7F54D6|nr:four-jointed box protein 1-like [Saccostrea echinata]XP_061166824.1 four-jointed box protein 1-like [Saccostrea echinata]